MEERIRKDSLLMDVETIKDNCNFSTNKNEKIKAILKQCLMISLDCEERELDLQKSFLTMGINSVKTIEFVDLLNERLSLNIGVEVLFDYENIEELSIYLVNLLEKKGMDIGEDQNNASNETIEERIRKIIKKHIDCELKEDSSFYNMGISSVSMVDISDALTKEFEFYVGVNVFFDYETISELVTYIKSNIKDVSLEEREIKQVEINQEDIAVVGLSGRFPGASNVQEFWNNLCNSYCGIKDISREGWNEAEYYDSDGSNNTAIVKKAGLLGRIDEFDPLFFNISPKEAEQMDPQQRIFLEEAFHALEDSGYAPGRLAGEKVGVYVGVRNSDYKEKYLINNDISSQVFLGNDTSILASRLSYFLNLKGASMAVDTACSSSLVAIHLACESIKRGEMDMALAGGVFVMTSPQFLVMASKTEMLSPSGKCKTFDESADGIAIGESVGCLVLKKLSSAIRNHDHIYGVIKGSVINQDGRTKGITAPSSISQRKLLEEAYSKYNINPETIGYMEAHGTGTKLGDPIEVKALTDAFGTFTEKKNYCAIGSHKPNIGHTIMAAGVSGAIKVLLSLENEKIPPTINVENENRLIQFEQSPFYVCKELKKWDRNAENPRRAAISAFGFGGTNCHIIFEEAPKIEIQRKEKQAEYLAVFSARTKEQLNARLEEFQRWITEEHVNTNIEDICYTLLCGRDHYKYRCAFICQDAMHLREMINSVLLGKECFGYFSMEQELKNKREFQLTQKALDYVMGDESGLFDLYDLANCKRISLPGYPFEKNVYWIKNDTVSFLGCLQTKEQEVKYYFEEEWQCVGDYRDLKINTEGKFLVICNSYSETVAKGICVARGNNNTICYNVDTCSEQDIRNVISEGSLTGLVLLNGLCDLDIDKGNFIDFEMEQEKGIYSLFRILKWIEEVYKNNSGLSVYAITNNVYRLNDEGVVNPYPGAIPGFIKSIAKEENNIDFRCLDIDFGEKEKEDNSYCNIIAQQILKEEPDKKGNAVVIRGGKRYKLHLVQTQITEEPSENCLVEGGNYVIVGGAGGIGTELSVFLAKKVNANIILIGRSSEAHRSQVLERIKAVGASVKYYQADICDEAELEQVFEQIRQTYGKINGVIHAALVYRDRTLRNMTEQDIRDVLAPKTIGFVNIIRALKNQYPDFIMAFSSVQSMVGFAGQSSYAASCSFKDVFCDYLDSEGISKIKVINWGFWGEVGVVAKDLYQRLMSEKGIYSISVKEGMQAISRMLSCQIKKLVVYKAAEHVLKELQVDFSYELKNLPKKYDAIECTGDLQPFDSEYIASYKKQYKELTRLMGDMLIDFFKKCNCFVNKNVGYTYEEIVRNTRVCNKYNTLIMYCLTSLNEWGYIKEIEENTWEIVQEITIDNFEKFKNDFVRNNTELASYAELLWICLKNVRAIISGDVLATDYIFPDSSSKYVEAVYKKNPITLHCNENLAKEVGNFAEKCIQLLPPGEKIKIFEIGAGTGSTSVLVFDVLSKYQDKVEYYYTDISKNFVVHGKKEFSAKYPFVKFICFNVEKDPEKQKIEIGSMDVVIATNVLHATKDMNRTLGHINKIMGKNGRLFINELTSVDAHNTLTFGMLDGWWLYTDYHNRMPYSPLINVKDWTRILREERFHQVRIWEDEINDYPGKQSIIMADSMGIIKKNVDLSQGTNQDIAQDIKQDNNLDINASATESSKVSSREIQTVVVQVIASALEMQVEDLETEVPFIDFGVDSILAIEIVKQLNMRMSIQLKTTDLFNYSNIEQLSDHIEKDFSPVLAGSSGVSKNEDEEVFCDNSNSYIEHYEPCYKENYKETYTEYRTTDSTISDSDIAIIGMSGIFPDAENVDEFWENLKNGINSVREITRWDVDKYYTSSSQCENGKVTTKWCAELNNIETFDPLFFNISPAEAELMDPQQRLFLQEAWKALEDAGYSDTELDKMKCGVFAGYNMSDYADILRKKGLDTESFAFTGNCEAIMPARIAYFLNLKGPNFTVNTGCSASMVAIESACESLLSDNCKMALVGSATVLTTPRLYQQTSNTGMQSRTGQCRTFDKSADGFVTGEAVAVVVLKKLKDAILDGDQVYGVIVGRGINQDGKTNGITAPSVPSQVALETEVYTKYNINPENITYIETHGTGTKLGDPIEIDSLKESFSKFTNKKQYCAVGSVKTNIGHTQGTAGIVGVIKTLLCLRNKKLVPSLNYKKTNEMIDFENSPFYVNTETKDWIPNTGERYAAVSSFGFSGTNVHLVLKEYSVAEKMENKKQAYLFALSAKNEQALKKKLEDLCSWNNEQIQDHSLHNIAYTLAKGRSHFGLRIAFIAHDKEEYIQYIKKALDGEHINGISKTKVHMGKIAYDKEIELNLKETEEKLSTLLGREYEEALEFCKECYLKGYSVDWKKVFLADECQIISMPTYPFAKERCWVDVQDDYEKVEGKILPLVDKNISNFSGIAFERKLSGKEFFLRDHMVSNCKVLPGVVHLEIARSACEYIAEEKVGVIKNVVWAAPVVVDKEKSLQVLFEQHNETIDYKLCTTGDGKKIQHSAGKLFIEDAIDRDLISFADILAKQEKCYQELHKNEIYKEFDNSGIYYGKTFQTIEKIKASDDFAIATISLSKELHEIPECILHPSLTDGVLQTVIGLMQKELCNSAQPYVPFTMAEMKVYNRIPERALVYVEKCLQTEQIISFNFIVYSMQGKPVLEIKKLAFKKFEATGANKREDKNLYYVPEWKNIEGNSLNELSSGNTLLLYHDNDFASYMSAKDVHIVPIKLGERSIYRESQYEISRDVEEEYVELLDSLLRDKKEITNIIYELPRNEFNGELDSVSEYAYETIFEMTAITKAIVATKANTIKNFLCLSMNAEDVVHKAVAGWIKTASLEYMKRRHIYVEMLVNDSYDENHIYELAMSELQSNSGDNEIKYENGKRYVKRMVSTFYESSQSIIRENGVYIISGGMGGIGRILTEHLAQYKGVNIVLTGRSALEESKEVFIQNLCKNGVHVEYKRVDISNMLSVLDLINEVKGKYGKINGIVHSAGVICDTLISNKRLTEIRKVIAPKINGIINLDYATKNENLDFVIMCSSVASVLGNIGQSDYAYANRFMDGYADYRNKLVNESKRSGKTISINWPLWRHGGMSIDEEKEKWLKKRFGMDLFESSDGVVAFEKLIQEKGSIAVLSGEEDKISASLGADSTGLTQINSGNCDKNEEIVADVEKVSQEELSKDEHMTQDRMEKVINDITNLIAELLKVDSQSIDIDEDLAQYGMDSITMMSMLGKIEELYDTAVAPDAIIDNRTVEELSKYLISECNVLSQMETKVKAQEEAKKAVKDEIKQDAKTFAERDTIEDDRIAVVGLACRFPKSPNADVFWENLKNGRDLIQLIPEERWKISDYFSKDKNAENKSYSKWGGFIDDVYGFDADYFGVKDANEIDPQHKILLELVENLLQSAGIHKEEIAGSKTGVFIGGGESTFVRKDSEKMENKYLKHLIVNTIQNMMAARISDYYDLHGIAETIDTACSSSLTAIHQACQCIRTGECNMAIAGGIELLLDPYLHIAFSKAEVLSDDGKCHVFDQKANGFVPGEGAGLVLLKSYKSALESGDIIYGVISGSAVNNDGHTMGLTVPNVEAQKDVIRTALEKSKLKGSDISYIETHGTGTLLGDPIEIKAARTVFEEDTKEKRFCAVGSVKSNMGHLFRAAGVAGFIKVILALRNKMIPMTINCETPHQRFHFEDSPFYPALETKEWKTNGKVRRAGISSFGFGGTNCHMILEEFLEPIGYVCRRQKGAEIVFNHQESGMDLKEETKNTVVQEKAEEMDAFDLTDLLVKLSGE